MMKNGLFVESSGTKHRTINASIADHVFFTSLVNGTLCQDTVRLFLRYFSNDEAKKATWTRVKRELIPDEYLMEYDEYHVKQIMAG